MPIDPIYSSAVSRRPGPREHIQCDEGEVGEYVLLPGDPGRVPLIAAHLDGAREVAYSREYRTWTGTLDGAQVSVTSTGIGGPSAAIAIEELAQLGVRTFIRIGTCGALQPELRVGELVIATAAVRDEGTSRQYAPLPYPAVSSPEVVDALRRAATDAGVPHHAGVVHTTDSYYAQHEAERMPIAAELAERYRAWQRLGALCSEMETAPVLVLAGGVLRRTAGSVLAVAGNRVSGEHLDQPGMRDRRDEGIERAISTAVAAVRSLIRDSGDGEKQWTSG